MAGDWKRLGLMVTICGLSGMLLGATTSQAAIEECLTDEMPSNECLTQDPVMFKVESVGMGLIAGVSAAIGATWHARQK